MKHKKIDPKLKKFVRDIVQKHGWNIGLTHFEVTVEYMDEDKPEEEGSHILGEMVVDRRYLKGTMRIYPRALRYWDNKDLIGLEEIVSHEVAHLATQHFYDVATATYRDEGEMRDAWETCTEVIGRMSRRIKQLEERK